MKEKLKDFYGNYASETETAETIRRIWKDCGYVIDTHTAVAACVYEKYRHDTKDETPAVIASTASPYKFGRSVMEAIGGQQYEGMDDFQLADEMEKISGVAIPDAVSQIRTAPVLHNTTVEVDQMPDIVKKILGIG